MFAIVLFNGLQLDDKPPGSVRRYRQSCQGAWLFARVLIYAFRSFPILWSPNDADDADECVYSFKNWLSQVEQMNFAKGSWALMARQLQQYQQHINLNHDFITDLCRAIIELAIRDAEIERNCYRARALHLRQCSLKNESTSCNDSSADETAFMARVRSAIGYKPRLKRIERCVYRAVVAVDVSIAYEIAKEAPDDCTVHEIVAQGGF